MAGEKPERADAAANRERILGAAKKLLAKEGPKGLTMQAVADAAGVGKGTVFHRFGSRDGLTAALIDEYTRNFQDEFLSGPPPLGPGAPAGERIEAFVAALVRLHVDHIELAIVAELLAAEELPPAYATFLMHLANLIVEVDPEADAEIVAGFLMNAVAPPVLYRMHTHGGIDLETLQSAAVQLVRGLTGAR